MIKTTLSFLLLLFASIAKAQDFPYTQVSLLEGKTVKPIVISEQSRQFHYKNFYQSYDTETHSIDSFSDPHFLAKSKYSSYSPYNELVGKEFKVIKIYQQKNKDKFIIELHNEELGTVFYDYNSNYEHDFELEVVGGIEYPEGFFCDKIEVEKDKFTKKTTYITDTRDGISFFKFTSGSTSNFYISANSAQSSLNTGKKGLFILLENGIKIQKPNAKVKVDVYGTDYVYNVFEQLNKNDISLLKKYKITNVRIYTYDEEVNSGVILKDMFKCLIQKK